MSRTLFTDGWMLRRNRSGAETAVRLPYDAMIAELRSAEAPTGNHGGYFPGGVYAYSKRWTVPLEATEHTYRLFFEGVYGDTRVLLNGVEIGRNRNGYREFSVALGTLAVGADVLIEVIVDNTDVPNSRWYTGAGIYRPVWLETVGAVRFASDGVQVVTRSAAGDLATATVRVLAEGVTRDPVAASVDFSAGGSVVVHETATLSRDGVADIELRIPDPDLWSAETPRLYDVRVALQVGGTTVDEVSFGTGLRVVEVDARRGLRINGRPVVLRGAAVHHDNGILGAATFPAAERRRAWLLKANGFNAIRSAHNPLSRAFLDACDEIGLYVMDELTDVWVGHKTPHDGADRFTAGWRADAASMIAKDRNRPSVIMYSIGNEVAETASPAGVSLAREIHDMFAAEDPTRLTTLAVNPLLNMMAKRGSSPFEADHYSGEKQDSATKPAKKGATSTMANLVTARLGRIMELMARLPAADAATRDAFATVDVAGYNYAFGRYRRDRKRYPDRVILGSESMPGDLAAIRRGLESVPGAIGDFVWTGWDYLGEAGIGVWSYGKELGGINKPYPALSAGCGLFDITGLPGAPALLARAVWDPSSPPGIAVRPLDRPAGRTNRTPWRPSDAIPSWSWGQGSATADVEVYSPCDEVELQLNGRSLGRKPAGRKARYRARFRIRYQPGELVAIGYQDGTERSRSSLRSAGTSRLRLRAETSTLSGPDDLAFVWAELADDAGTVDTVAHDQVTVQVDGPGTLAGLGGADPFDQEAFTHGTHSTYRGRILAVIRGGAGTGEITVTATSRRHGSTSLTLRSESTDDVSALPYAVNTESTHA